MLDFAQLPPEVNSALMYAGPGSGPMLAAAAAWEALAAELQTTASTYDALITGQVDEPGIPRVDPYPPASLGAALPSGFSSPCLVNAQHRGGQRLGQYPSRRRQQTPDVPSATTRRQPGRPRPTERAASPIALAICRRSRSVLRTRAGTWVMASVNGPSLQ